jgi:hypothetical protein
MKSLTEEERKERARARWLKWKDANPEKRREARIRYYEKNKHIINERRRSAYSDNPDKIRSARRKWYAENKAKVRMRNYGIDDGRISQMLRDQNGSCAICSVRFVETSARVPYDIDHCHKTRKVRGLLCNACNKMLGLAKDNPDILKRGAEYLDEIRTRSSD